MLRDLNPAAVKLLKSGGRPRAIRVWKSLSNDERLLATKAALDSDDLRIQGGIQDLVARNFNFRRQKVRVWPADKVASYASRAPLRSEDLASDLLVHLHIPRRSVMLCSFLDLLGIERTEDGMYPGDDLPPSPDPGQVTTAVEALSELYDANQIAVYLLTLAGRADPVGEILRGLLPDLVAGQPAILEEEELVPGLVVDTVSETEEPDEPEASEEFTTLDNLLIRATVNVAQEIEGALSVDELDDLINELLHLNSERHRSFFHAGFSDVVLDRDARDSLPAENESRSQWYWAGYIHGLARQKHWADIAAVYDEQGSVATLGQTNLGPSFGTALLIFSSLCMHDRHAEAASFLRAEALSNSRPLFFAVEREASKLLKADRAPEARAMFDLLEHAMEQLETLGVDTKRRSFLEIRRRQAHCHRLIGDSERARSLLGPLLDDETDPEVKAMVLADLGLLDAGFRGLADVQLPASRDKLTAVAEALAAGDARFKESLDLDATYSAHGAFCLGVLHLLRNEYASAAILLERALSVFEGEPDRYGPTAPLGTARLYMGLAQCLDLQESRMRRASEQIRRALAAGVSLPPYLIPSLLESIAVVSGNLASEVASALLDTGVDTVLDSLQEAAVIPRSKELVLALLARVRDASRGDHQRNRDRRLVLPLLLSLELLDEAGEVLDGMEECAHRGVDRPEFIGLLENPQFCEPVWNAQDVIWARVRLLEVHGDCEAAAQLLIEEGHRVLGAGRHEALDEVAAICERIRSYGLQADCGAGLENRIRAVSEAEAEDAIADYQPDEDFPVSILVIGGDETQARHDDAVKEAVAAESITVIFLHPGWSGNWGGKLDEAVRLLDKVDAVVLMPYMRTEFGRQVRKRIVVPWVGCSSTGRDGIARRVRFAARLGRRQLEAAV